MPRTDPYDFHRMESDGQLKGARHPSHAQLCQIDSDQYP